MSRLSRKVFHAKVLLFGEHIINRGAQGIAVPLKHFDGVLRTGDTKVKDISDSNRSLELLANYIIYNDAIASHYFTNDMLDDIERGLYFDSDIPQGYGLGSSGALVAAIYNQYHKTLKKKYVMSETKRDLARLESYFHGTSSGLDPLVIFMNKAVLINNGEVSETFDMPKEEAPQLKVFLVDTGIARSTSKMVEYFLAKCSDKVFITSVEKSWVPANNLCIASYMKRKHSELMKGVKLISQLQLDMLPEFIPHQFHDVWLHGLKYNKYYLKICGAGGGGFILGFANADTDLDATLGGLKTIELMRF